MDCRKHGCEPLRYGMCESSLCLSDLADSKVGLGCVGLYFILSNHWMFRIPFLINTETTSGSAEKRVVCDVINDVVKKSGALYGTGKFITVFRKPNHWFLS